MSSTSTVRSFRALALLAAILFTPGDAFAGGFATARFGAEEGHAASDSPTTIYYNPAGLALGSGTRLYAEGLFAWRNATYDRPEEAIDNIVEEGDSGTGTPREAVGANSGEATLFNVLASPFLGAVTDFGVPNLGVGIAAYVPFGGQATWDENSDFEGNAEFPGAVDGVQRWATIQGQLQSLYVTAGGAYRLPGPRLSFGVGVNLIRSRIDTIRARVGDGTDHLVSGTGNIVEGRSLIDVSSTDLSVSGGVIWEPIEPLAVGLSYQARPAFGEMKMRGDLITKFGSGPDVEQGLLLRQELPDIIRLGVRYQPSPQLEVRFAADYQRWSGFDEQCLIDANIDDETCKLNDNGSFIDGDGDGSPDSRGVIVNIHRDWADTFGAKLGASYWASPTFEINGSLAFDSNAVPDETIDPALMDMNKFFASAGLVYSGIANLRLALTYTQVIYLTRDIAPRMEPLPPPSRVPDGAGEYKQLLGFATLGVQYSF